MIEAQVFATLLAIHQEVLTLSRGSGEEAVVSTFKALVQRPDQMSDEDKRKVDFSPREASIVQMPKSAVTPPPKVGEALVDEDGKVHRVSKILPAPGFVKLVCKIS